MITKKDILIVILIFFVAITMTSLGLRRQNEEWHNGYAAGYEAAHDEWYEEGYEKGYEEGYHIGINTAE